jgi:hypothetical protein
METNVNEARERNQRAAADLMATVTHLEEQVSEAKRLATDLLRSGSMHYVDVLQLSIASDALWCLLQTTRDLAS